jgi:hypothetical protein
MPGLHAIASGEAFDPSMLPLSTRASTLESPIPPASASLRASASLASTGDALASTEAALLASGARGRLESALPPQPTETIAIPRMANKTNRSRPSARGCMSSFLLGERRAAVLTDHSPQ